MPAAGWAGPSTVRTMTAAEPDLGGVRLGRLVVLVAPPLESRAQSEST
jgi:hypothetical protein